MKKRLFLLWFASIGLALSAQINADSLCSAWEDASLPDTLRLSAVHGLSIIVSKQNPDSARALATQALGFAQKIGNTQWQGKALTVIGLTWRGQSDYAKAMQYYEQSIPLLEAAQDRSALSDTYKNMGDVYRLQINFLKAIDCITQSLTLAQAAGDKRREADAYVCYTTIYYAISDDVTKIEEYLLKAKPLYESTNHEEGLSFVYNNLALIYIQQKNYGKALEFMEQCLQIQEKRGDLIGAATSFHNKAFIFTELGRYEEALKNYEREIAIFKKIGDQDGLADAYSNMGGLWIAQNRYPEAIRLCTEALNIAVALGGNNMGEANACHCLYTAYAEQGNYKKALEFLERLMTVRDSLQQSETAEKLKQMELEQQSATDSLEQAKEKFKMEQALRHKDKTAAWLLAGGLGAVSIALAFLARMLYFQRRSQQMQNRSEALEKQQLLNEIDLLKTQVNPHFLFNSLSILSSLVHVNADLSEQFIEQLARSYRYILEQKDQPLVTLRTELEFIRSYSFLLKIRFENKFDLCVDLPEEALDKYKIAPLTLQLLVENAVKHNRMSVKEPLVVEVSIQDEQTLVVKNRLQPRSTSAASTGIGLQNIINRYALLTDRPVWAGECEDAFKVKVPLLN
jgi:tetratricopeptide (TPR) repeat protein